MFELYRIVLHNYEIMRQMCACVYGPLKVGRCVRVCMGTS